MGDVAGWIGIFFFLFLILLYFCMYGCFAYKYVHIWTAYVPHTQGDQKGDLDALGLELQTLMNCLVLSGNSL